MPATLLAAAGAADAPSFEDEAPVEDSSGVECFPPPRLAQLTPRSRALALSKHGGGALDASASASATAFSGTGTGTGTGPSRAGRSGRCSRSGGGGGSGKQSPPRGLLGVCCCGLCGLCSESARGGGGGRARARRALAKAVDSPGADSGASTGYASRRRPCAGLRCAVAFCAVVVGVLACLALAAAFFVYFFGASPFVH